MNDYSFGNRICQLRTERHLSQTQLGEKIGISNKAISKWENGISKPTTDTLRKLACVLDVSVEELLSLREKNAEPDITKIVITGGPCAGKSTAMSWVQNAFTKMGYTVLFVPETATELITGGVAPWTCATNAAYQKCQMKLQLEKEKVFEYAARTMAAKKVLLVCDRGVLDNKAYMNETEFAETMRHIGSNEVALRDSYDAVFHLVTAAKGAKAFYSTDNNSARTETADEAAALDDKLISAWTGHPHFRVIDNSSDFEWKMKKLVSEISGFLGEPEPLEIERKFLIEYPNIKWLESLPNCQKVEIIQTYLKSNENEEVRVRQRGFSGNYIYFKTTKRKLSGAKRIEIEKRLSQAEYLAELMNADTERHQVRKDRYCLSYKGQYFEIDIYPFWNNQAICEIELNEENAGIEFPKQLKILKEVTEDDRYKNYALALLNS